jgi:hypothetical protein
VGAPSRERRQRHENAGASQLASSRRAWSSVSAGVLPRRTTCFGGALEMGTGYATLWNTFKRITAGCSHTEKLALYSGTAVACGFTPRSVRGVAAGAEPEDAMGRAARAWQLGRCM